MGSASPSSHVLSRVTSADGQHWTKRTAVTSKFTRFRSPVGAIALPAALNDPFVQPPAPHALCIAAARQLQRHLLKHEERHRFGLDGAGGGVAGKPVGKPVGKMFGVLVVARPGGECGFLSAFSGKLAGGNHHAHFVPPVFDTLAAGGFLNAGMDELAVLGGQVRELEGLSSRAQQAPPAGTARAVAALRQRRKAHSKKLLRQLFESYVFLNSQGQSRAACELFDDPPAGAGECAAPKLLQYAYQNSLRPLCMSEFWWGNPPSSSGSTVRVHGKNYPACEEKCRAILAWMLS